LLKSAIYYFDPTHDHPIPHNSAVTLAVVERVSNWNVETRTLEEELRRQLVGVLRFHHHHVPVV
jgi:hypothetical protein